MLRRNGDTAGSCVFEAHASVRVSGSRVVKAMESSFSQLVIFLMDSY